MAPPLLVAAPPHCCWADGTPVHTFELSVTSSSSPQVPPMFVEGVCPHGVFCCGWGGGCPPFLKLASHSSVPLFTVGFQAGAPEPSIFIDGSGLPGMSQFVSWLTCCPPHPSWLNMASRMLVSCSSCCLVELDDATWLLLFCVLPEELAIDVGAPDGGFPTGWPQPLFDWVVGGCWPDAGTFELALLPGSTR